MTKAVILARGLGTRMRRADARTRLDAAQAAAADAGTKALIPVGGRPFLDYVLAALATAGVTDACLVIGPEHGAARRYYAEAGRSPLRMHFAVQAEPIGTANAVVAAEAFTAGDPFLVLNADNYYPPDVLAALWRQPPPALPAFDRQALLAGGNITADRIAKFALLEVAPDGRLLHIWEKPDAATLARLSPTAPVSMNVWWLDARMVQACREVPRSSRGEYELPRAVEHAVQQGVHVHTWPVRAPVLDLTERGDIVGLIEHLARLGAQW